MAHDWRLRSNWPDIELWDTRTWTMQKRLSLYDPKRAAEKRAGLRLEVLQPLLRPWDNLYVVEQSEYHATSDYWVQQPNAFPYAFPGQRSFGGQATR